MPTQQTLKKYGINMEEWQALYDKHGGACHICLKVPSSGRLNIDHFHVPKWRTMPPEDRKKFIRGLLCYVCNNRILTRGVSVEKLKRAVEYLEEWENKKPPV